MIHTPFVELKYDNNQNFIIDYCANLQRFNGGSWISAPTKLASHLVGIAKENQLNIASLQRSTGEIHGLIFVIAEGTDFVNNAYRR